MCIRCFFFEKKPETSRDSVWGVNRKSFYNDYCMTLRDPVLVEFRKRIDFQTKKQQLLLKVPVSAFQADCKHGKHSWDSARKLFASQCRYISKNFPRGIGNFAAEMTKSWREGYFASGALFYLWNVRRLVGKLSNNFDRALNVTSGNFVRGAFGQR